MGKNLNTFASGGSNIDNSSYFVGFSNTNSGGEKKWLWSDIKIAIKKYIDEQFVFHKAIVNFDATNTEVVGGETRIKASAIRVQSNINKIVRIDTGLYEIFFNNNITPHYVVLANGEMNGDQNENVVPYGLTASSLKISVYANGKKTNGMTTIHLVVIK